MEDFSEVVADYTKVERNLVHVCFKNVIGPKRVLVRTLDAIMENPKYNKYTKRMKAYKTKVRDELIGDATYMIDMLQSYCIDRKGNGAESNTFFYLMAADLTRYICEQTEPGTKLADFKDAAVRYYERAEAKCANLHNCCPTKMSRDLHHANFLNEYRNDP